MEQKLEEKQFDIVRKALELLGTVEGALTHLVNNSDEANEEAAVIEMFRDICKALASIDDSLADFTEGIDDEQLVSAAMEMVDSMNDIAGMLERQEIAVAITVIEQKMMPAFRTWAERLRINMEPKIVC